MLKRYMGTESNDITRTVLLMVLFTLISVFSLPSITFGEHGDNKVTPYGDYCNRMSHYGMHKSIIDLKHAEEALKHYYSKKGLDAEIISHEGRFIKVKILDEDTIVDMIIFDRRTGRIRSIY